MAAINSGYQGLGMVINSGMVQASSSGETVSLTPPLFNKTTGKGFDLTDIIDSIIGFIFWLGIVICPIYIVWGGFEIATAAGNEQRVASGRTKITYAVVGLVIIALSKTMVYAVKTVLGA